MNTSTTAPWKRFSGLAGLLLLLLGAPRAQAQTWLVSTDAFVKIGVSDKFGQLGAYTAKFIVTNQGTGKEYSLVKEIEKGQNGIDVVFPSPATENDYFKTEAGIAANGQPGNYIWYCEVAGKKVAGGRFVMPTVANDVTVVDKRR